MTTSTSSYRITLKIPTGPVTWAVLLGLAAALTPLFTPGGGLHAWAYDTGVYFGASLRLVHGVLPYRDFALMHPPGIALLLSPISVLSYAIGSSTTVAIARLVTIACVAANAGLVARLTRWRGRTAAFCGGAFLALYAASSGSDTVVMLEPFLVLFCLAAFWVAFEEGAPSTPRRAWWAGVLLGLAGLIKIWAIFILIPLVIAYFLYQRATTTRLLGGAITSFTIGAVPFMAIAPSAFVRDIVTSQVLRTNGTLASPSVLVRFRLCVYLLWRPLCSTFVEASALGGVLLLVAASFLWFGRREIRALDVAALLSILCIGFSFATSSEFYSYYIYFLAPFVAITVAFVVSVLTHRSASLLRYRSAPLAVLAKTMASIVLVVAVGAFASASWHYSRDTTSQRGPTPDLAFIDRAVPPGACVSSNNAVLLILANRFDPNADHCPAVIDPFGLWLALAPAHPQPSPAIDVPQVTQAWQSIFAQSPYVLLDRGLNYLIPWTPALQAWFNHQFVAVARQGGLVVYVNIAH
jgi:4-amino-4-deoxy-L-arabinose transferase-like glycosyltransferase